MRRVVVDEVRFRGMLADAYEPGIKVFFFINLYFHESTIALNLELVKLEP